MARHDVVTGVRVGVEGQVVTMDKVTALALARLVGNTSHHGRTKQLGASEYDSLRLVRWYSLICDELNGGNTI